MEKTTSTTIKRIITILFNLGVPVVIIVYSLLQFRAHFLSIYISLLACLVAGVFLLSFFLKSRLGKMLRTTAWIFNITYILLELTTYFLLGFGIIRPDMRFFFGGIDATDRKFAQYDSISGFRGVPGNIRYLSIENGSFEIDHRTKVNQQGWFSNRDYTYKKHDTKTKRYMVLGDSYSSGLAVATAWPDLVQNLLVKNGNDSIELYNFSLESTGLPNWYRTFFYEIVPKYEFDGVIIASSSEKSGSPDFDRLFMMMNSDDDATYIKAMDISVSSVPPTFPKDNAPPILPIYSSPELDKIKNTYVRKTSATVYYNPQSPDLWFLAIFYGVSDGLRKMLIFGKNVKAYKEPYEPYYALAGKPYKMQYFNNRFKYAYMLKEIISYCKKNKKNVIMVGIPDYENSVDYVNGKDVICRQEIQFLAQYYDIRQFDGFEILKGKNTAFVDQIFYKYDRHWNKTGVGLFAQKIAASGILETP